MITIKNILETSKGASFISSSSITTGRNKGRLRVVLEFPYSKKQNDGSKSVVEHNHATFII